jgi:hypothetical protein
MYLYRNIGALLCNHCLRGKAISATYSECVFLALGIQHAMHMYCYIVICVQSFDILTNRTTFGKKLSNIKCVF